MRRCAHECVCWAMVEYGDAECPGPCDAYAPMVDVYALLELVKELELGTQCVVGRKWPNVECERMAEHLADDYEMIVCRIRKALGVDDGD